MNESPVSIFQEAISATHGTDSKLLARVAIHERFEGETVWEGEVLVFELLGHPEAQRCYAWEVDGRVTAVLGVGPVDSPAKAIRAAILADSG